MATVEHYDILILGGGKSGKTLGMDQAKAGKRVAVVEVGMIGGSCINIACIPTKALVRSAQVAHLTRRVGELGVMLPKASIVDMGHVAARTAEVVAGMVEVNAKAFAASGFELVLGWGRFVESGLIEVAAEGGTGRLTGERIRSRWDVRNQAHSDPTRCDISFNVTDAAAAQTSLRHVNTSPRMHWRCCCSALPR